MAPELLLDSEQDDLSKVDTYAAGVVLVNMLTGGKYVKTEADYEYLFPSQPDLVDLLCKMLQADVSKRISLQ